MSNVKSTFTYPEVTSIIPLIQNGSLIEGLGDYEAISFGSFRTIDFPGLFEL
jgi:hypothetical protein